MLFGGGSSEEEIKVMDTNGGRSLTLSKSGSTYYYTHPQSGSTYTLAATVIPK